MEIDENFMGSKWDQWVSQIDRLNLMINMKLVKYLESIHVYEEPEESSVEEGECDRTTIIEKKFSYNFILEKDYLNNYSEFFDKIKEGEEYKEFFEAMDLITKARELDDSAPDFEHNDGWT